MSGVHKYPTISFRISPREREEIEAKILASGLSKKDYFVRSCIYNRVCVVGKKELVYQLVEELKIMQTNIREVTEQFEKTEIDLTPEGLEDMRNDCLDMLKAILWVLDGAKYLWQGNTNGEEKSPVPPCCSQSPIYPQVPPAYWGINANKYLMLFRFSHAPTVPQSLMA